MSVVDTTSGLTYSSLSAAITGSAAGDVIQISAGSYVEDFPLITHDLTIQSVGGLASLTTPNSMPANGRAILEVPWDAGVSLTIDGLELSGATDALWQSNGAGLLFEQGNNALVVRNSWIHDNQDGILTGSTDSASTSGMTVTIDHSEINSNGVDPSNARFGYDHNLYIGAVDQLTVTNSLIYDALGGHEIKSRALSTTIEDNRIFDGATAPASYSIDVPDGGTAVISGNVIEKGASTPNRNVIHFGGEGTYANSQLLIDGNTIINDRGDGTFGLLNQTLDPTTWANDAAIIQDNVFYGIDQPYLVQDARGPQDTAINNLFLAVPGPTLDYSSPFETAIATIEPAGFSVLLSGVLLLVWVRRGIMGRHWPAGVRLPRR